VCDRLTTHSRPAWGSMHTAAKPSCMHTRHENRGPEHMQGRCQQVRWGPAAAAARIQMPRPLVAASTPAACCPLLHMRASTPLACLAGLLTHLADGLQH
jgi:hypothetical protein